MMPPKPRFDRRFLKKAFGPKPDLLTAPATSTSAAIDLVRSPTGVEGLNIMGLD